MKIWRGASASFVADLRDVVELVPQPFRDVVDAAGVRVRPLRDGETYDDVSAAIRAAGGADSSLAALYVAAEKTLYVRDVLAGEVVHAFGHAFDHALGGAEYFSTSSPEVGAAFTGEQFVTSDAAERPDELFAESFRAYVGGAAAQLRPPEPSVERVELAQLAPAMADLFGSLERDLARGAQRQTAQPAFSFPDDRRQADDARFVVARDSDPTSKWTIVDTSTGVAYQEAGSSWRFRTRSREKAERLADDLNGRERGAASTRAGAHVTAAEGDRASRRDFRAEMTAELVAALERGTAPWQRSWDSMTLPYNAARGNQYRGGNTVRLLMVAAARGYNDPRWMTFKQASERGYRVRRGERGTGVEYWKTVEARSAGADAGEQPGPEEQSTAATSTSRRRLVAFYATVFNAAQIDVPVLDANGKPVKELVDERGVVITDANRAGAVGMLSERDAYVPMPQGVALPAVTREFTPIERCERLFAASGAHVVHTGDQPCYIPSRDVIEMPAPEQFHSAIAYYATKAHELGHWTGHKSRLDRDLSGVFGTESYAREELRAELASMFLQAETGIPHDTQRHAAYVGSWIEALQRDKHEIFRASADAQRITEFLLERERTHEAALAAARGADDLAADARRAPAGRDGAVPDSAAALAAAGLPPATKVYPREQYAFTFTSPVAAVTESHVYAYLLPGKMVAIERDAIDGTMPGKGDVVQFARSGDRDVVTPQREVAAQRDAAAARDAEIAL